MSQTSHSDFNTRKCLLIDEVGLAPKTARSLPQGSQTWYLCSAYLSELQLKGKLSPIEAFSISVLRDGCDIIFDSDSPHVFACIYAPQSMFIRDKDIPNKYRLIAPCKTCQIYVNAIKAEDEWVNTPDSYLTPHVVKALRSSVRQLSWCLTSVSGGAVQQAHQLNRIFPGLNATSHDIITASNLSKWTPAEESHCILLCHSMYAVAPRHRTFLQTSLEELDPTPDPA
jgi:hypothetical protein